jgi:GNAT superfamily N-acetyltransferase
MPAAADLEIVPLTGDRFADLGNLFATGDPRWCWCMYFRVRGRSWANSAADRNRSDLEALAATSDATGGVAPGLVAYRDGSAIGWVSLAPREEYERLAFSTVLRPVDERQVWSIVCFVVAGRQRGRGVAIALLDAAIAYARGRGATTLEAYPIHESRGRVSSDAAYTGTQRMFERAGFEVVEVRQWNATSSPRPIVRLELGAAPPLTPRRRTTRDRGHRRAAAGGPSSKRAR